MTDYMRVIIDGRLRCLSELHLGSGESSVPEGEGSKINEIVLDCAGRPVIPASSLRGYLAQRLAGDKYFNTLLGYAAKTGEMGEMGALRIYDARLADAEWQPLKRTRVAIDPITRTARENHLINEWLVSRDSIFQVRLELDEISKDALESLLDALSSLNITNPQAQLGQGKSHGRGRIAWEPVAVRTLDQNAFADWLGGDGHLDQAEWRDFDYTGKYSGSVESWRLEFHFDEPVLINDLSIVPPKQNREDNTPNMCFMRTNDGRLLIPGASIKGLFRARARRILLTMGADGNRADELLASLFGSTSGMGALLWYDAVADITKADIHEQTIIAIDRFTGGVQEGALLNLEAARPEQAEGALAFRNKLKPWQHALMLLLLRDAMEGDMALGWGQARGFGGFHLRLPDGKATWNDHKQYMKSVKQTGDTDEFWNQAFKELGEQLKGEEQEDVA